MCNLEGTSFKKKKKKAQITEKKKSKPDYSYSVIIWRKPHAVLDGRWRCWMTTFCLLVEKAAVVVGKEAWFIFWMALGMCSWNDNLHFWPVQSAYEHMAVRNLAWVISTSIFLFILFLVFAIQDCFSAWSCRNETNKKKSSAILLFKLWLLLLEEYSIDSCRCS